MESRKARGRIASGRPKGQMRWSDGQGAAPPTPKKAKGALKAPFTKLKLENERCMSRPSKKI
jgi:hypothetical protein